MFNTGGGGAVRRLVRSFPMVDCNLLPSGYFIVDQHKRNLISSRCIQQSSSQQQYRNYTVAQYVDINDQKVMIKLDSQLEVKSCVKIENVISSPQFNNWLVNIKKSIEDYRLSHSTPNPELIAPGAEWKDLFIRDIEIQSIDTFGVRHQIGFVKFKVNIFIKVIRTIQKTVQVGTPLSKHGSSNTSATYTKVVTQNEEELVPLPGIVFARGGSVGILIVLECEGQEYLLLVQQPRIPIGTLKSVELPAGSIDDNGNFSGVAAKEVKEETGIEIKDTELVDLTELCFGNESTFPGHYLSPGGSDEFMRFFLYKTKISMEELNSLKGKFTGSENENEFITLRVVSIDEAPRITPDAKLILALYFYSNFYKKK